MSDWRTPDGYRVDWPDCLNCGHPGIHHDAGECWTRADGSETWDDNPDNCRCDWYSFAGGA
jgi:hypothetical protein